MEAATLVEHIPYMKTQALRHMNSLEDAEDITQEACIRCLTTPHQPRKASVKTWLFRMVLNLCADKVRRDKFRRGYLDYGCSVELPRGIVRYHLESHRVIEAVDVPKPDQILEFDAIDALEEALLQLNASDRGVLIMRYLGFSYEQIAKAMNVPLGTIRSRLFYAKWRTRKLLDRSMF